MLLCKRLQYTWTQLAQWVGTERGPEDSGGLQVSALQREAENVSVTGQLPPCSLKTKHGFFVQHFNPLRSKPPRQETKGHFPRPIVRAFLKQARLCENKRRNSLNVVSFHIIIFTDFYLDKSILDKDSSSFQYQLPSFGTMAR